MPEQKQSGLARQAWDWLKGPSRPWAHGQAGKQLISMADPALYRYMEAQERRGGAKYSAEQVLSLIQKSRPGREEGPTLSDMLLSAAAEGAKYPAAAIGAKAGSPLGILGAGAGAATGWGAMDIAASMANPQAAMRPMSQEVGMALLAKGAGTGLGALYRRGVQPALASRGLLSPQLHPTLARNIAAAEKTLLAPATGPGAPGAGVPRGLARTLRKVGPRGAPTGIRGWRPVKEPSVSQLFRPLGKASRRPPVGPRGGLKPPSAPKGVVRSALQDVPPPREVLPRVSDLARAKPKGYYTEVSIRGPAGKTAGYWLNPISGKMIPTGKDVLNLASVRRGLRGLGKGYAVRSVDTLLPGSRGVSIAAALTGAGIGIGLPALDYVRGEKKYRKSQELLEWGRARKRSREGPPAEELAQVRVKIEKMKKEAAALRAGALP